MKQSNFRAKLLGERQRITERFPGGLGKVDRHKDGFQFEARGRSFAQRSRADSLSQHAHTGSALHPTKHLRNLCFHRRTLFWFSAAISMNPQMSTTHRLPITGHFLTDVALIWKTGACQHLTMEETGGAR